MLIFLSSLSFPVFNNFFSNFNLIIATDTYLHKLEISHVFIGQLARNVYFCKTDQIFSMTQKQNRSRPINMYILPSKKENLHFQFNTCSLNKTPQNCVKHSKNISHDHCVVSRKGISVRTLQIIHQQQKMIINCKKVAFYI